MSQMTVAQWVTEQLAVWGVKYLYGVPGEAILPFLEAINNHPTLRFVSVNHEATAAFMASAQAKLNGSLGVCVATSGPGVANLVNGLLDAKKDRAPVLALTGQVDSYNIGTDYKQSLEENLLLATAVGFSGLVTTPEACNDLLIKALRSAVAKGLPMHVAFSKDVWQQTVEQPVRLPEPYLHTIPQSAVGVINQAISFLNEAERPAILIGRGVANQGQLLIELAEKWQSGITITLPAKGTIPGEHPLVLGGLGEGGSEATTGMLAEADLLLIAGATWWPELYLPENLKIIQVDAVPENIGGKIPVNFGVVGDLAEILPLLRDGLAVKDKPAWRDRLQELKTNWLKRLEPEITSTGSPVPPGRLIKAIENVIAANAIVCLDVGDHTVWFNRIFAGSNQKVLVSGNWRSMGFALPAALSAQLAFPGRQVVVIVGDGGLAQSLSDFSTAVREELPITVLVVKNRYLGMEKGQMQLLGMNYEVTKVTAPDFAGFARLCGGLGYKIESSYRLEETLTEAMANQKPSLIEVETAVPIFPGLIAQWEKQNDILERSLSVWV